MSIGSSSASVWPRDPSDPTSPTRHSSARALEAIASSFPSSEKASLPFLLMTPSSSPVVVFHNLTNPSRPAVARMLPSVEKTTS